MEGSDAFDVTQEQPPLDNISQPPQPFSPPPHPETQPPVITVEAEDTHGVGTQDDKGFTIEHQQPGGDVREGAVTASAGSAQVITQDPNLRFEGEDLALPYGNNDLGVTSEIVHSPQTGGPSGAPPLVDADVQLAERTKILAGNQSDITTDMPSAPAKMGTDGTPTELDPGLEHPVATPPGVNQPDVTNNTPTAPQTDSTRDAALAVDKGGQGALPAGTVTPPVQYGQSAP